jgi:hypothetical protein
MEIPVCGSGDSVTADAYSVPEFHISLHTSYAAALILTSKCYRDTVKTFIAFFPLLHTQNSPFSVFTFFHHACSCPSPGRRAASFAEKSFL